MSVNSKVNRHKRLRAKAANKSLLRSAYNKGRIDGLAKRPDITMATIYVTSHQLNKINYAYRSARDKAIMRQ
jgi:hypothetical protein